MKENKKYEILVSLSRETDLFGKEKVWQSEPLIRQGVSEKQVIARLRYSNNWYDHDNSDGSESYKYDFKLHEISEKKEPEYEQLSLF